MDDILDIMELPVLQVPISADHSKYSFFWLIQAQLLSVQPHHPKRENVTFIYSIQLYTSFIFFASDVNHTMHCTTYYLNFILTIKFSFIFISNIFKHDTTECPDGQYGHNCKENCCMHCMISGKLGQDRRWL